jgi:DNA helicase-2/ATP-dependent DNA helicase PcrA
MISQAILDAYPSINKAQREIVAHGDGPLLVIAGPGSGKTFSLVLRALNLLLLEKAEPGELVICTFTEKAAFELRDRLSSAARKIGYKRDLSELQASTIHGFCNRMLNAHRHRTLLGANYETLDELTQQLFIYENFAEIAGQPVSGRYLGKWTTKWQTIRGLRDYFNKITEELIDPLRLLESDQKFFQRLGDAYLRYRQSLLTSNRLDFAHQQKLVYDLLLDQEASEAITQDVKYVMVDEYQDTNYVQEQILLKLTEKTRNLCVIGDEDQSLYRFRGATVRNILEFTSRVSGWRRIKLTTNYRSHRRIVEAYDRWMASADWSNASGQPFRFDKTIRPDPNAEHPEYPAVFSIWANGVQDEAERFADLIAFLKEQGVISDYSQVALLLRSVQSQHSGHYLAALEARGIRAFCPRARTYFENEEVRLVTAALAVIFGWYGDGRNLNNPSDTMRAFCNYVDQAITELGRRYAAPHPLAMLLQNIVSDLDAADERKIAARPADFFYRLLAVEPFSGFLKNEARAHNLAIFSYLLNTFQNYYHYSFVTSRNRDYLRFHLFSSFLLLLYGDGLNEYEDPHLPFPKDHVQVMTIHQSKGLEFPVVIVGSLDKQISTRKQIDRELAPFMHRPPFEPEDRITTFDRMRLHYVAFSRPEKLLALTTASQPKPHFAAIWQGLPQWPYVKKDLLAAQRFEFKERIPVKRSFSFTGDLKLYETCPRQYQFYREYDFTPSRSAVIFFGLLVHQTIEEIHRIALDGKLDTLDHNRVRELFDRTFAFLAMSDVRPIGEEARETAFTQVINYFDQNQEEMKRVIETEVDVSVEKDDYILAGKVDLLLGGDGKLELLDFKTSPKPVASPELMESYKRQLCTYAHILERRHGKRVDRLLLYWTSEPRKQDALMELPYRPDLVEAAGGYFDQVVAKIQSKNFDVRRAPEAKICRECDFRRYCHNEGTIRLKDE